MAEHVGIDGVRRAVRGVRGPRVAPGPARRVRAVGFDDIYLHYVGQEQAGFLDAFGEHVLPALRG